MYKRQLHALGLSSGLEAESTGRIVIQRHSVAVNPSQVYPGQLMNIGAAGFAPGEKVRFELHSDPLVLGVAEADVNGVARLNNVMLDKAVKAGVHEVVAYGETTGYEVDVPVMVKQLPPQQNNLNKVNQSQPGARGAQFKGRAPKTGETNNLAPYALLSVFAAGCLLISRNRRKEQN